MSQVTEQQLNDHRVKLQEQLEFCKAAERLTMNPDFKKVIMDGFMGTEASRYVQVSTDLMLSTEQRADALATAQASGYLKRYLQRIHTMGNQFLHEIQQVDQELEFVRTNATFEEQV